MRQKPSYRGSVEDYSSSRKGKEYERYSEDEYGYKSNRSLANKEKMRSVNMDFGGQNKKINGMYIDPLGINDKSEAEMMQEKAKLEDNMKDLAYMELISGVKQKNNKFMQKQESQESFSPEAGMSEFSPVSSASKKKNLKWQDQQYMNRSEYNPEQQVHISGGLTPKASKHYEGVKTLYQQEIDLLKQHIWSCSQNDQRILPEYEKKEDHLWESFSQSPSPEKGNIFRNQNFNLVPITEEEQQPYQDLRSSGRLAQSQSHFGQSPLIQREELDDSIEKLRRENNKLKEQLRKQMSQQKQPYKEVKFKDTNSYNLTMGPSYAENSLNPYTNNQINQENKENKLKRLKEHSHNYSKDEFYMCLVKGDNENENEVEEQYCDNSSPYKKLNYYDQLQKSRYERSVEETGQNKSLQLRQQYSQAFVQSQGIFNKKQKSLKKHTESYLTPIKNQHSDTYSVVSKDYSQKKQKSNYGPKDIELDTNNFYRKVSKYDIDRGLVDFNQLKREKQKEITENCQIKRMIQEQQTQEKKLLELKQKQIKIEALSSIKEKQDNERKEQVKKNSEALRKAIQSRKNTEINSNYLSPHSRKELSRGSKLPTAKKTSGQSLNKNEIVISDGNESPQSLSVKPVPQNS